jgi:hypothetical protein
MVQVGDRVEVDGRRVGQQRRPGVVTSVNGSLVSVRWEDGHQSTFVPAAGTMSVVKGDGASGR